MKLFDTHFHWDGKSDFNRIIREANDNSVEYFVCVGGDYYSSSDSAKLAEVTQNCWFTAGVHPHYADDYEGNIDRFIDLSKHNKFVGIGEVGLDYFYDNSDRRVQRAVFERFAELALELGCPMVVHVRDKEDNFSAYDDTYKLLSDFSMAGGNFVIHCYTGNLKWLDSFMALGAYIGITGIVTFPRAENVRDLIKFIADDRLVIETDSPYLAPKPHRGKVNYPKYLIEVANAVADIKNINVEELAKLTTDNAFRFYTANNRVFEG